VKFLRLQQRCSSSSFGHFAILDELLCCINKNYAPGFVRQKAHFGAEFRYAQGRIDQEPRASSRKATAAKRRELTSYPAMSRGRKGKRS